MFLLIFIKNGVITIFDSPPDNFLKVLISPLLFTITGLTLESFPSDTSKSNFIILLENSFLL
jgi:hypothetical protein